MSEAAPIETVAVYARIKGGADATNADVQVVPETPEKIRATGTQANTFEFHLDRGFSYQASQEEVYTAVGAKLVDSVTNGFNACILAYGQTGSGKTYTMLGPEGVRLDGSGDEQKGLGIVPRACIQLFKLLPTGYTVTTSYMEVYNDGVNDCLAPAPEIATAKNQYLRLAETSPGHIEPDGLTRVVVKDTSDVMKEVARGDSRRVVAAMAMNPRSSRGHGIIVIEVKNANGERHGRLTLVDLAGMESSKKSYAVEGASNNKLRQEEAKRINMSLLALSGVINALASKGQTKPPFRDSKLTRLLQSSLAGNCKAAIIVTLRSEKKNIEEAINTLRFAQRAKAVSATVMKNEDARKPTGQAALNKMLNEELNSAKEQLTQYLSKLSKEGVVQEELRLQVKSMQMQMLELQKTDQNRLSTTAAHYNGNASLEERVRQLEARNLELEDEVRVLRQRDLLHNVMKLSPNQDKDAYATTFQAHGFSSMVQNEVGEQEHRRGSKAVQKVKYAAGQHEHNFGAAGKPANLHGWSLVRAYTKMVGKKRSAKVAPVKKKPYKKKWRPDLMSREELAAVTIQKHWRRFAVIKELDQWDQYFEDAWEMYYADD